MSQFDCDLTMFTLCKLSVLMLMLTLHGQVHTGKIIGGHEAVPHSRPYMVLVEAKNHNNEQVHCGGFLLSEEFVMTAAHCQKHSYRVTLGLHNFRDNNNEVQHLFVEQAFPHEGYHTTGHKNDIMLLKLATKAKINCNVKPVDLAEKNNDFVPKSCIVSGWGRTDRNKKHMSLTLMEVNVTLIDDKGCAANNVYCSKGDIGPGEGDSGGPLVCEDGKAYGVVSASSPRNSTFIYRYASIPENREWIDGIMKRYGQSR